MAVQQQIKPKTKLFLKDRKTTNLFGIKENEGLSTEQLFTSWNRPKINILVAQDGLVDFRIEAWGKCERQKRCLVLCREASLQPWWKDFYLSGLGGGRFCWTALLSSEKNSGFTMGQQHSKAEMVWNREEENINVWLRKNFIYEANRGTNLNGHFNSGHGQVGAVQTPRVHQLPTQSQERLS